jgi:hypothetical protein
MTVDEVLEKAIKDYPIGTKYIGFEYNGSLSKDISTIIRDIDCYLNNSMNKILAYGSKYNYCYYDGQWAEIISYPENYKKPKVDYKYLIKVLKKYKIK